MEDAQHPMSHDMCTGWWMACGRRADKDRDPRKKLALTKARELREYNEALAVHEVCLLGVGESSRG